MSATRRFLRFVRQLLVGNERSLAREAQCRIQTPDQLMLRRFRKEFAKSNDQDWISFGSVPGPNGTRIEVGVSFARFRATSLLDSGPTGAGKTTLAAAIAGQLIARPRVRLWSVDPKGDMTEAIALLFNEATRSQGHELKEIRILRPFEGRMAAPLRLTAREPGVPIEVQAMSLATALAEVSGADLGHRMVFVFRWCSELAIELGAPLTLVLDWLARPTSFAQAAARSVNPRLRHYALMEFSRENRQSIQALRARLEGVLLLPSVRRSLEAPGCIDFVDSLERFHVLVDLSNPPAGEEAAVRMLGAPVLGRMTRAILNRRRRPDSPHVVLFLDELPELLGRFETGSVGRLVALARARGVSLFLIAQERGQLGSALFDLLRTNCGIETVFRPSRKDAETLAHALPVPEGIERLSVHRDLLIRKLTRLPRQNFLLWFKDGRVPAQFAQAPHLELAALRDAAPPDMYEALSCKGDVVATGGMPTEPTARSLSPELDRGSLLPADEELGDFPSLG
jgi:hypothetical protein